MILLSFDIEGFNLPKEHGVDLPFEEQIKVSVEGTTRILDCLQHYQVKATFFCTANFALYAPEVIKRIQEEGHEIASHGFDHREFQLADLRKSKEALEKLTGVTVYGYRQPRMKPVPEKAIFEAGYKYNSSLNPTFIPGRYMNISIPRITFSCRMLSLVVRPYSQTRRVFRDLFPPMEILSSGQSSRIPFIIRRRCGGQAGSFHPLFPGERGG